jgi:hypothetical protein
VYLVSASKGDEKIGSPNSKLIEQGFTREQRRDFTIRREMLREFPDETQTMARYLPENEIIGKSDVGLHCVNHHNQRRCYGSCTLTVRGSEVI